METPCLGPLEGDKHGAHKVTNICHWVLLLKGNITALEIWQIEINASSSASTV